MIADSPMAPTTYTKRRGDCETGDRNHQQGFGRPSPSGTGARGVQELVDSIEGAEDPKDDDSDNDDLRAYRRPAGEERAFSRARRLSPSLLNHLIPHDTTTNFLLLFLLSSSLVCWPL